MANDAILKLRISPALKARLEEIAHEKHEPLSVVVREALRDYVTENAEGDELSILNRIHELDAELQEARAKLAQVPRVPQKLTPPKAAEEPNEAKEE